MSELVSRLKPLFRRTSTFSSTKSSASGGSTGSDALLDGRISTKSSLRLPKLWSPSRPAPLFEDKEAPPQLPPLAIPGAFETGEEEGEQTPATSPDIPRSPPPILSKPNPQLTVEAPTPQSQGNTLAPPSRQSTPSEVDGRSLSPQRRPSIAERRRSLTDDSIPRLASPLLKPASQPPSTPTDYFGRAAPPKSMQQHKKIWVKRPGSSATQVMINEDDLVDDVRDMILRKYANSLGRNFDSPDVTLRIIFRHPSGRHSQTERTLGPEEHVSKILDLHYPGGQAVEEALVIDVPQRRTPRHSPHLNPYQHYYIPDESARPRENGTDYFPPMPVAQQSPHLPTNVSVSSRHGESHHPNPHSITVMSTGQLPNLPYPPSLPSPGAARIARHSQQHRPKYGRQHTSSPTIIQGSTGTQNHENLTFPHPGPIPMASPTIHEEMTPQRTKDTKAATPPLQPPRPSSPHPRPKPPHKPRSKKTTERTSQPAGSVRDGAVPPINVLIVEDNIINLRLLEAFMKRLKVRWSTAMDGKAAVTKWREGGFHLVLMDIQLPVMNGLDATKEIRRLERVNSIGVFSNSASTTPTFADGEGMDGKLEVEDSLMNTALFKSPVIIVALTASSLQSDRHEALAAGCNDFLTKPVNFEWLTRKVMEWGCMQALIDFDGWRKWKDFSSSQTTKAKAALPSAPLPNSININTNNTNSTNNNINNVNPQPSSSDTPSKSPKAVLNGKTTPVVGPSGLSGGAEQGQRGELERKGSEGTDTGGDEGSGGG